MPFSSSSAAPETITNQPLFAGLVVRDDYTCDNENLVPCVCTQATQISSESSNPDFLSHFDCKGHLASCTSPSPSIYGSIDPLSLSWSDPSIRDQRPGISVLKDDSCMERLGSLASCQMASITSYSSLSSVLCFAMAIRDEDDASMDRTNSDTDDVRIRPPFSERACGGIGPVDFAWLHQRCGDDNQLVFDVLLSFCKDGPNHLHAMQSAIRTFDINSLSFHSVTPAPSKCSHLPINPQIFKRGI